MTLINLVLAQGFQALGAQLDRYQLAIPQKLRLLDVGLELALGVPLGKTDVVPKHWLLATHLTDCHNITFSSYEVFPSLQGLRIPQPARFDKA
jgi:hypothetical protein